MVMAPISPKLRSEELINMFPAHKQQKQNSKCFVYTLAAIVTIFAVLLAFASIVWRVKDPKVEMKSAKAMHLSYSNTSQHSPSVNVTMIACVTIMNTNFGRFNYEKSKVNVLYGAINFGAREIGGGRVDARETKEINVMVNIRSNKEVLVSGNLTNDIDSGVLELRSYAKLSGTVELLKIVKKRKTVVMACIMNLNLNSHSIQHFRC